MDDLTTVAEAVRRGLTATPKSLPPFLFYDARGSELFDRITELPEYYVTRAERAVFEHDAHAIVDAALEGAGARLTVLELGAGTAGKTQLLLRALAARQGSTRFVAADVSPAALEIARARIVREEPNVEVRTFVGSHAAALAHAKRSPGPLLVLFIGSSIGNYENAEAVALLSEIAAVLGDRGTLLLGADLRKSVEVLVAAYDDAAGVTAEFNKNVLARVNRELGGRFDLDQFRHVALWNEAESRIEMHLESRCAQSVRIAALGLDVRFGAGERIHTESSHKYDEARVEALFAAAGLVGCRRWSDAQGRFAVHLARQR